MKRLFLLPFLAASAVASADPIAGKIALGTWGTQAEFADVKVVQGSRRLYASSFVDGMKGWTKVAGAWSTSREGLLRQTGTAYPALATIGNAGWTNYTLTLKARKTGGAEGFLIGFGMPSDTTKSWWNIGGWNNTQDALEAPGMSMLPLANSVQTGRWYSVKVEVSGSDVRCYLDGRKVYDTMRVLNDGEWDERRDSILGSQGLTLLPSWEADQVRELLNRWVYHGQAARERYDGLPGTATFQALPAREQANLIRKVNRYRMTWEKGWGWGGNETWRDDMILGSMERAVMRFNAAGIYDKHLKAHVSPGTPTADAGEAGEIRFGGSREYPVALHEISHTLGTGTNWRWEQLMWGGDWHGDYANLKVKEFDGPNAIMHGDGAHYWPYGQNQNWEWSLQNEARTLEIITAFRRDMGISGVRDTAYTTDVADGTYRLTPRLALNSALEVPNGDNAAPLAIRAYSGAAAQKFRLERQEDGSYIVRTALPGARCLDIPGGWADNGAQIQLWDDNGLDPQRWYLIPMGDGFYKIAPKNNVWRGLDLWGISDADGTPVKLYDFWDGKGQQFRLDRLG